MKGYGEENSCCNFHPSEVIVGVCALCLKERLLILASKQGHIPLTDSKKTPNVQNGKNPITLPKIFDLSSSLHRLKFKQQKSDTPDQDTLTSQEDSFISIKFEENGVASWDKGTNSNASIETFNMYCSHKLSKEPGRVKSVVEHAKPRVKLRWRKHIGHLFQLSRWKRSSKANMRHVGGKVEGVKVKKGWIRNLTKMRTME